MAIYEFRVWAGPSFVMELATNLRGSAVVLRVVAGTEHVYFRVKAEDEAAARQLAAVPCAALRLGTPEFLGEAQPNG
jgi:hypothetical protein